jgi:hypothetical protein
MICSQIENHWFGISMRGLKVINSICYAMSAKLLLITTLDSLQLVADGLELNDQTMMRSNMRWNVRSYNSFNLHNGFAMKLRGGLPTINGVERNRDELLRELRVRDHDLICKVGLWTWLLGPNYHHAMKSFDALEDNAKYVTARSAEHAWKIHLENVEKGVVDLEPIRPAAERIAFGVALGFILLGTSSMLGSAAALITALKADSKKHPAS